MAIEANLRALLLANATVTALVGTRIYPAPRKDSDALVDTITYSRIDTPGNYDHAGDRNPIYPRIQFDCWGAFDPNSPTTSYAKSITLLNAVKAVLNGYHGTAGSGGSIATIMASLIMNEYDNYDPETQRKWKILDVQVWHSE
jgi:hypothetical protein